jgi:hypothetical protein
MVIPITDNAAPSAPAQLTGPSGHETPMQAPAQGQEAVPAEVKPEAEKPTEKLLAGKYKTPEELHKGVSEVLKGKTPEQVEAMYLAMLKATQPAAEPAKPTTPAAETPAPSSEGKAIDPNQLISLANEVLANGTLSEETRKSIRARGYTNEQIDGRIAEFQKAVETNTLRAALIVGGEEPLGQMKTWLQSQSKSFQKMVNLGLYSSDKEDVEVAANLLKMQFAASSNSEPRMQFGRRMPPNQGLQPFASQSEKHAIQRSRAYTDSSHPDHAQVHAEYNERAKLTLALNPSAL